MWRPATEFSRSLTGSSTSQSVCVSVRCFICNLFIYSNLATLQAESKLENTEGNCNQESCCQANTSNQGRLGGGPVLGSTPLLVREEGLAEEMEQMSEPRCEI